jgi:hypothetical protein
MKCHDVMHVRKKFVHQGYQKALGVLNVMTICFGAVRNVKERRKSTLAINAIIVVINEYKMKMRLFSLIS